MKGLVWDNFGNHTQKSNYWKHKGYVKTYEFIRILLKEKIKLTTHWTLLGEFRIKVLVLLCKLVIEERKELCTYPASCVSTIIQVNKQLTHKGRLFFIELQLIAVERMMELEKSSFYSPGWNNDSQWEKPLDERLRGTSQWSVGVIITSVLLTITKGGASKHWASPRDALGSTQLYLWITPAKTQNHVVVSLTLLELASICRRHGRKKFNKWHYGETGRQIQNVGQLEQTQ